MNRAIRRLRAVGFIGLAAAIATPSAMAELYVGTGKTVRHSVDGNVTQGDNVVIAPRGTLVKTGEGTWTLPTSKIMQGWGANLAVEQGTLKISQDSAPAVTGFETPPAVMQDAAVWFDVRKADSFVRDGSDKITDWLDCRETGNATDGYLYTRAQTDTVVTNLYPELKERDGTTGLYFQGYKSGCWMNLRTPANAQASVAGYNVFAVQGQFEKYGALFGCRKNLSAAKLAFVPGNASGAFWPFWTFYCHDIPAIYAARIYIDGGEVDAFTTGTAYFPNDRFALLEVEFLDKPGAFQCFFNDRDFWASWNAPGMNYNVYGGDRIGGEYICEVVAFTNALTAAERLQVEGYLMAKWFGVKRPASLSVTTGEGTQIEIESAGADAEKLAISFGGSGDFMVPGGDFGLLSLLPGFSGRFSFSGNTLGLRSSMPFAVNDGEQLDVSLPYDGPTVVRTAADAGKFVKSGAGTLRANEVPQSVKRLDVLGGEMVLEAPRNASTAYAPPDSVVTGYVPNASFENGVGATTATINLGTTTGFQGWTAVAGAGADLNSLAWVNHSAYNGGKNDSSPYWNLSTEVPDGESVLTINKGASVWTTITLPQEGVYELSFMGSGRSGKMGLILELAVGADAEDLQTFGYFRVPGGWPKFYPYSYRLPRLAAGSHQLWFKQVDVTQDRCSMIDDLKLVRIPDKEVACYVPNGTFEHFKGAYADLPQPTKFTAENFDALADWTITRGVMPSGFVTSGTTNYFGSGPVLPYMCQATRLGSSGWTGQFYNQRESGDDGFVQLYLMNEATASVTFTPPAGRYFVEADIGLWRTTQDTAYNMDATGMVATVTGGAAANLGVIEVHNDYTLKRRRYPKAFTADGTNPITLTLGAKKNWQASEKTGTLLFDNVRLVPADSADGENLIGNGSFSFDMSWTYENRTGLGDNYAPRRLASSEGSVQAYGANWYDSGYSLLMIDNGLVYQDIPNMDAGRYRLSLAARKRVSWGSPTAKETDPVRFWMAKGGVTNEIAQLAPPVTNFTMYSWTFVLPESGAWRFGVEGLGEAGKDMNTLMDGFSLVREPLAADAPEMDEALEVNVASGAKLRLDYPGTQTIGKLRLAGRAYSGLVRAADHPESLLGDGALYVPPKGIAVTIR